MKLDVEPPSMDRLTIYGELFFDEARASTKLQANLIIIAAGTNGPSGLLRAGTAEVPFPGTAIIQLNGNFASEAYIFDEDRDAGNMALVRN
jgi:hypothetical protein